MEIVICADKKKNKATVAFYEELEDQSGVVKDVATKLVENDFNVKQLVETKLPDGYIIDVVKPNFQVIAEESGHIDVEFDIFKL